MARVTCAKRHSGGEAVLPRNLQVRRGLEAAAETAPEIMRASSRGIERDGALGADRRDANQLGETPGSASATCGAAGRLPQHAGPVDIAPGSRSRRYAQLIARAITSAVIHVRPQIRSRRVHTAECAEEACARTATRSSPLFRVP